MNYPQNLPRGAEPEYEAQQRQLDAILEFAWLAHAALLDTSLESELLDMARHNPASFSPAADYQLMLWPGNGAQIISRTHTKLESEAFKLNDKGDLDDPPRSFLHIIHIEVSARVGKTRMLSEVHRPKGSFAQQQTALWQPGNEVILCHRQGSPWIRAPKKRAQKLQLAS